MHLEFVKNNKTVGGYLAESGIYQISVHPLEYTCSIYIRVSDENMHRWFRTKYAYTFLYQDNTFKYQPSSETMLWNTDIRTSVYLVQAVGFMYKYYSSSMNPGGAG